MVDFDEVNKQQAQDHDKLWQNIVSVSEHHQTLSLIGVSPSMYTNSVEIFSGTPALESMDRKYVTKFSEP